MDTTTPCVICDRPSEHVACIWCQRRTSERLGDIVTFVALAEDELLPGRGGDGRSTERGLGVRLDALDLVAGNDVLPVLESWERLFREEWGFAAWGQTTLERGRGQVQQVPAYLTGTVSFLRSHLDRIFDHPAVDEFAVEVGTCWHQARKAASQEPRQAWRVTCPTDVDDGECGTWLRVTGEDFGGSITCRTCRTTWPTDRLLLVVASSSDSELYLDADAIMRMSGVTEMTLRRWAKDGKLQRRGNLYSVRPILEARVAIGS
jgi:hypothetical protein